MQGAGMVVGSQGGIHPSCQLLTGLVKTDGIIKWLKAEIIYG
jgi:hypothetical protein